MAGKQGDIPLNSNDNNENLNLQEANQQASENLLQASYKPADVLQKLENSSGERFDPKVVETAMNGLQQFMKKYFEPDPRTGTSIMDRLLTDAPDLHAQVASGIYELNDKSQQTGAEIQQFLKKLQV